MGNVEPDNAEASGLRSSRPRMIFVGVMLFLAMVFIALGTWQVQRLFWKMDLIARVDARVHAHPIPAPGSAIWRNVSADQDEYRHVTTSGVFLHDKQVMVQAVTERGAGFWVVTPLMLNDGTSILINRGFVPAEKRDPAARHEGDMPGPVQVTGLLRLSEPDGAFLRTNDPTNDRWYSRDVSAIASAKTLSNTAPYFIDADASPNPGGFPIGGLTVINFRNSHLVYLLTWYAMAAMSFGAALAIHRRQFR